MNFRFIILPVLLLFISCKKDVTTPNNGIYRGEFAEITFDGDTMATGIVHLALNEENSNFQLRGDTTTLAPPTHSGSYDILENSTMDFTYKGNYDTLYNPNHYLDTVFNYVFDDVNFELSRTDTARTYKFIMERL